MAAVDDPDPSPSMRRQTGSTSEWIVDEHEHIREVDDPALEEIGKMLSQDVAGHCYWQELARCLGLGDCISDINIRGNIPNPAYEVLLKWSHRERSTILVLLNVLTSMHRRDIIDKLQHFRHNYVLMTVSIRTQHNIFNISGRCPGKMPLAHFIRTRIHRKISNRLYKHNVQYVVRITNVELGLDVNWTSPVKCFQGQELKLEMKEVSVASEQFRNKSEIGRRQQSVELHDCNVISWIEDDVICFETSAPNLYEDSMAAVVAAASESIPVSIRYENPSIEIQRDCDVTVRRGNQLTDCGDVDEGFSWLSLKEDCDA